MGCRRVKAVGLFSGGLDSVLAARLLMNQQIEVHALTLESPFFGSERGIRAGAVMGIPVEVRDVTDLICRLVEDPPHGHGKNLNPCLDCHAMMFREAGVFMEEMGADFLFSGEVLGQRPFSQNYQAMLQVADLSGYGQYIVRPLSARLLPRTKPEEEGSVDREKLLDIQGRSRARQMALAYEWGIKEYASPAGGCCLTDPGFCGRLSDLLRHNRPLDRRAVRLLKYGRHFRLGERVKAIVGRKHSENQALEGLSIPEDVVLEVQTYPGPTVLVTGPADAGDVHRAAELAVRYSDAPSGEEAVLVRVVQRGEETEISAGTAADDVLERIRV
ncbi:MAG: tRNA 4-thiouridine(8) synthase ThiI [Candidatus Eisenbacteria sp.]|nr:tRNA 4-thiouridine(8) synthase ThiI [Candidatus Eisenbacteria bacterium]